MQAHRGIEMAEPASGAAAGAASVVIFKSALFKLLAGAVAAGLLSAVLWPRTAREGISRITCTIAGSMLGGKPLLALVTTHVAWYPAGEESAMLVYVCAGLPAWWVIGGVARWFDKRRGKDIAQTAKDAADNVRAIR